MAEDHSVTIDGKRWLLREEAEKRKLLFVDIAGRVLVRLAIKRARQQSG